MLTRSRIHLLYGAISPFFLFEKNGVFKKIWMYFHEEDPI
jgi:hypothetical protein